jgi:hypothetical protein
MKNSRAYSGDAFRFYKSVCSSKQDAAMNTRLLGMDANIRNLYAEYDRHFNANSLELLDANGYINQERLDLGSLYDYSSAKLTALRNELTTTPTGRVIKCQNCTINDISTFDHMLPQGEFVEFNVHPRNLMCCCADCNPRRSNIWRSGGRRTTLNLYLDTLPDVQYLFVVADVGNSAIETTFRLRNVNDAIDVELFSLLQAHYQCLHLYERFSAGADTVITSLKATLEPLREFTDLPTARALALQFVAKERIAFGTNYWQSILKMELLNSDDFMIDFL